jgi:hypothetical protein
MSLAEISALLARHHFLPDNMALWRKDEAQKALSNVTLALDGVVPRYEADTIC